MNHLLPAWVEVDTAALAHNLRQVRAILRPGVRLLAVVKNDGYGCGAPECARVFLAAGADWLGVATLEEGVELRRAGIDAPVLLLAPLLPGQEEAALAEGITPSVSSRRGAVALAKAARGTVAGVHLEVETGLGRSGIPPGELPEVVSLLEGRLRVEGIYTHFAAAASDTAYTALQYRRFREAAETLAAAGVKGALWHVANSAAVLRFPEMQLDMVRVGTLLYGQYPVGRLPRPLKLRNPWRVKARVLHLAELPAGSRVGYGGDHVLRRDTRLALLPVGHAHGLSLAPVTRPRGPADLLVRLGREVLAYLGRPPAALRASAGGVTVPLVGRVGMQFSLADVSKAPGLQVGDVVEVPLQRTVASPRLPRLYVRDEKAARA